MPLTRVELEVSQVNPPDRLSFGSGRKIHEIEGVESLRATELRWSRETSLAVQTQKTSDVWSDSQVRSEPKSRADTPLSVDPLLATPLRPFSTSSSTSRMQGAMASTSWSARRTFDSVAPTSGPIKAPMSSTTVGSPRLRS